MRELTETFGFSKVLYITDYLPTLYDILVNGHKYD